MKSYSLCYNCKILYIILHSKLVEKFVVHINNKILYSHKYKNIYVN